MHRRTADKPAYVPADAGVYHPLDCRADLQQSGTAHGASSRGGELRWLRAVREKMPGSGYRNAGEAACMGQRQVRDVPGMSASLPEIRNSV